MKKIQSRLAVLVAIIILVGCAPFSVVMGIGGAYVGDIPRTHLTGHEQFHLKLEVEKPISDNLSIVTGWNHYSNGAKLGIGNYPNKGIDLYGTRLEYKWTFK